MTFFLKKIAKQKESKQTISKIKIIHDDEEFGNNNHKPKQGRKGSLPRNSNSTRRGRSLDPLRLPKVEEAALQEEDQIKPQLSNLIKLDVFKDKNEFNLNEFNLSSSKKIGSFIEKSQFVECSELPIEEELEKEKKNLEFGLIQVPLKVDELDERKKRTLIGEQENIEIIEEDEKNDQEENKLSNFMTQCK